MPHRLTVDLGKRYPMCFWDAKWVFVSMLHVGPLGTMSRNLAYFNVPYNVVKAVSPVPV